MKLRGMSPGAWRSRWRARAKPSRRLSPTSGKRSNSTSRTRLFPMASSRRSSLRSKSLREFAAPGRFRGGRRSRAGRSRLRAGQSARQPREGEERRRADGDRAAPPRARSRNATFGSAASRPIGRRVRRVALIGTSSPRPTCAGAAHDGSERSRLLREGGSRGEPAVPPVLRRGRDLNPRTAFRRLRDFQSRSFGRSDTSPRPRQPSDARRYPIRWVTPLERKRRSPGALPSTEPQIRPSAGVGTPPNVVHRITRPLAGSSTTAEAILCSRRDQSPAPITTCDQCRPERERCLDVRT